MSEAIVKFSIQRFKSLLLEENSILSGLENQIQNLINILDEIGGLYSIEPMTEKHYKFESRWFRVMRDLVQSIEDYVDEFIILMSNSCTSDQIARVDLGRIALEKLKEDLVLLMNRMSEHKNEKADVKVEEEDLMDSSSQADEGEVPLIPPPINYYHINIPYYLRSCVMYCAIFTENYGVSKGKLVRLLVAEGLIQEQTRVIMEDVAEEYINTLVDFGVLDVDDNKLKVNENIRPFFLKMIEQFFTSCTSSDSNIHPTTRHLSIHSDAKNIPTNLSNLPIHSLFMFGIESLFDAELDCLKAAFHGKKFLRVLDLECVHIQTIPDEVGDLIHLRYLSLNKSNIDELPEIVSNLGNLQTLNVKWSKFEALPSGILNLVQLRHIKMLKHWGVAGVIVPAGIGGLRNLQTLTGLYAGDGIALELGKLTQLRKLGIMDFTENLVNEVCFSIMKMEGLLSLSPEAKSSYHENKLPSIEPFTPPPLLQKLRLEGTLERLPSWFSLIGNLKKLRLGFSRLPEDSALVLKLLPNLNHLTLWHAHDSKQMAKEFCVAGGFSKLEVIVFASFVLEEWTELEEGALPNLKHLHMHTCLKLRMLPEGLPHVTTIRKLTLIPLLDDHAERLKLETGEESYKIQHIPVIDVITTSMVQEAVNADTAE
ncbi:Disease resistance protein rpp13 protein [Thalictrum thalictroides]|uniref:Disease resistance protein rpp13 protein n=1 Tax=Thalictrum thalictroides TaxID=46969 RepID=A0A7J6X4P8_THATH|nr:Disease resistance protein rpp13 protein [Thalictrum thalictroides]